MMLQRTGLGQLFEFDASPCFDGGAYDCVEATLIRDNSGIVKCVVDYQPVGGGVGAYILPFNNTTKAQNLSVSATNIIPATSRFNALFSDGRGAFKIVGNENAAGGGHARVFTSGDPSLMSGWVQDGPAPVLLSSALDGFTNLAIRPADDTWHALIENPYGLYYSSASVSGDFGPGLSTAPVIPGGGNAEIHLSPCGRYLVAFIGKRGGRFGGNYWYTTAAVGRLGTALQYACNWRVLEDAFILGQNGYDICDPTVCDDGQGGTIGILSYAQNKFASFRVPMPLVQLLSIIVGH